MYYSEYYVNDIHHHLKPEVLPLVPASRFNPKASFKYALRPAFGMAAVGVTATVDVTDCGPTPSTTCSAGTSSPAKTGFRMETDYSGPSKSVTDDINNEVQSLGDTISGTGITSQTFQFLESLPTRECHIYSFNLKFGNPNRNTRFYIDNSERHFPCKYKFPNSSRITILNHM